MKNKIYIFLTVVVTLSIVHIMIPLKSIETLKEELEAEAKLHNLTIVKSSNSKGFFHRSYGLSLTGSNGESIYFEKSSLWGVYPLSEEKKFNYNN